VNLIRVLFGVSQVIVIVLASQFVLSDLVFKSQIDLIGAIGIVMHLIKFLELVRCDHTVSFTGSQSGALLVDTCYFTSAEALSGGDEFGSLLRENRSFLSVLLHSVCHANFVDIPRVESDSVGRLVIRVPEIFVESLAYTLSESVSSAFSYTLPFAMLGVTNTFVVFFRVEGLGFTGRLAVCGHNSQGPLCAR